METDFSHISIFNSPVLSFKIISICTANLLKDSISFLVNHGLLIGVFVCLCLLFSYAPGPHEEYRQEVYDFSFFACYWIGLGIASSIGLGTGLHTFVLYLGPHIAKVTLAAHECNQMPTLLPSRWKFDHFAPCPHSDESSIGFIQVCEGVFLEAFLWGFGTALGELPPYFVAKAASVSGNTNDEL